MRLTFAPIPPPDKRVTKMWRVSSGVTWLGEVHWYAPWRRYCFFPLASTLFDAECLEEIGAFLRCETQARKLARLTTPPLA